MSNVYYKGRQWHVSASGIEEPKSGYFIERSRLLEMRDEFLDWPLHLSEKEWVDLTDLEAAFIVAIGAWGLGCSRDLRERSFKEAIEMRAPHGARPRKLRQIRFRRRTIAEILA